MNHEQTPPFYLTPFEVYAWKVAKAIHEAHGVWYVDFNNDVTKMQHSLNTTPELCAEILNRRGYLDEVKR